MDNVKSIILAAGEGKRMKSSIPKVLHKIIDKPMIDYVIDAALEAGSTETIVVVGHKSEMVADSLTQRNTKYVIQEEQLGTGHAVMAAKNHIPDEGVVLVLYGDTPLITSQTLKDLIELHKKEDNSITLASTYVKEPKGYGRIVRDNDNNFKKIVEERDTNESEKKIDEINAGVYCFNASHLKTALELLNNNNAQNEYYLTDTIEILHKKGLKINAMAFSDEIEFSGINDRVQLADANSNMKKRVNRQLMLSGTTIVDPENVYIGTNVIIGMDTIILPGVSIEGETTIGEGSIIGPNTQITNCVIGNKCEISNSVLIDSTIGNKTTVGPFAYVRPNSTIGNNNKIGDFVEIKNSTIGDGTKVSHLTYIGDADVGKNVNFGCGTVIVNYDGKTKHRSTIEDNAFIGCNTNIVSPVTIKKGAYTAAGSTITKDVPEDSLGIARNKQENIIGWRNTTKKLQQDDF